MNRLDNAVQLAVSTHKDQFDLGGYPYILHPLRVLCAVERRIRDLNIKDKESVLCSAVLHDVIEDSVNDKFKTECEILETNNINDYITNPNKDIVLKTVQTLSRGKEQSWNKYINQVNEHWAPRIIKIYDLKDNLDLSRLPDITDKDLKRNGMYEKALKKLQETEEIHGH